MNILIIFRGGYDRVKTPHSISNNIIKYIIEPLHSQGYNVETKFCTYDYDLNKLQVFKDKLHPSKIHCVRNGQYNNFKDALHITRDIYNKYDYIIFLRFEIIYKTNIIDWNIFNKEGMIFPYKEDCDTWYKRSILYGDCILIFSKQYYIHIINVLLLTDNSEFMGLHNIEHIVHSKIPTIPMHCILSGQYNSNTGLPKNDPALSPLYIGTCWQYNNNDLDLYLITDPLDKEFTLSLTHGTI